VCVCVCVCDGDDDRWCVDVVVVGGGGAGRGFSYSRREDRPCSSVVCNPARVSVPSCTVSPLGYRLRTVAITTLATFDELSACRGSADAASTLSHPGSRAGAASSSSRLDTADTSGSSDTMIHPQSDGDEVSSSLAARWVTHATPRATDVVRTQTKSNPSSKLPRAHMQHLR